MKKIIEKIEVGKSYVLKDKRHNSTIPYTYKVLGLTNNVFHIQNMASHSTLRINKTDFYNLHEEKKELTEIEN